MTATTPVDKHPYAPALETNLLNRSIFHHSSFFLTMIRPQEFDTT
jgi:hypothetical protein